MNSGDKKYLVLLCLILFAASFVRLYDLGNSIFEGHILRDVTIAENIADGKELRLSGATAEIELNSQQQTLGPLYYYLLALPLFFLKDSVKNPLYMTAVVAIFNILSIILAYKFCSEFFNRRIGLIAAALFALNPWAVIYSRFITNPNFLPFFVILFFYALFKISVKGENRFILLAVFSMAAMLHLHLSALFLLPVAGSILLFSKIKINLKQALAITVVLLIMFMPIVYYNLTDNNISAQNFLSNRLHGETSHVQSFTEAFGIPVILTTNFLSKYWLQDFELFSDTGNLIYLSSSFLIAVLFTIGMLFVLLNFRNKLDKRYGILLAWILIPVILFALLGKNISPHFFLILYPAQFIVIALFLNNTFRKSKAMAYLLIFIVLVSNIFTLYGAHRLIGEEGGTPFFGISYDVKMDTVNYVISQSNNDINTPIYFLKLYKMDFGYLFEKKGYTNFKVLDSPEDFEKGSGGFLIINRFSMASYGEKMLSTEDNKYINNMKRTIIKHIEIAA